MSPLLLKSIIVVCVIGFLASASYLVGVCVFGPPNQSNGWRQTRQARHTLHANLTVEDNHTVENNHNMQANHSVQANLTMPVYDSKGRKIKTDNSIPLTIVVNKGKKMTKEDYLYKKIKFERNRGVDKNVPKIHTVPINILLGSGEGQLKNKHDIARAMNCRCDILDGLRKVIALQEKLITKLMLEPLPKHRVVDAREFIQA